MQKKIKSENFWPFIEKTFSAHAMVTNNIYFLNPKNNNPWEFSESFVAFITNGGYVIEDAYAYFFHK